MPKNRNNMENGGAKMSVCLIIASYTITFSLTLACM